MDFISGVRTGSEPGKRLNGNTASFTVMYPIRQSIGGKSASFSPAMTRAAIFATGGTAQYLAEAGVPVERVNKVAEGRPHIVDRIIDGDIALIFNTTEGWQSHKDSQSIRASALGNKVPYYTTAAASAAVAQAITSVKVSELEVRSLQDYYN